MKTIYEFPKKENLEVAIKAAVAVKDFTRGLYEYEVNRKIYPYSVSLDIVRLHLNKYMLLMPHMSLLEFKSCVHNMYKMMYHEDLPELLSNTITD